MTPNIRIMVLIGYGMFLFAGASLVIAARQAARGPAHFKAAHALPAGHLLVKGDLIDGGVPSGYLIKGVPAGKNVEADNLAVLPVIAAKKGFVPVAFSVAQSLVTSAAVNAGQPVDLCNDKTTAVAGAGVRAVICAPDMTNCIAIVDVAADKTDALKDIEKLTVRPNPKAGGNACE